MIFHLYNILLTFLLILASPYFLLRSLIQKRFRKALPQRMGFFQSPSFKKADLGSCGIGRGGILFHPSFEEDQKGVSSSQNRFNHDDLYRE